MKIRQIIGCILMVILTTFGVILTVGLSVTSMLNSNGIIQAMVSGNYLEDSLTGAKETLLNYLPEAKVEEVLKEVSVKSQIRGIAESLDNNTVVAVSNSAKESIKSAIIKVLDDSIPQNSKESFAGVVSEAYIKTIFPVSEFSILSNMCNKYINKITLGYVIIAIILVLGYIYLALGNKTYKWAIISIYNVIILTVILIFVLCSFNNIVIGNDRTTAVIQNMLFSIKMNLLICLAVEILLEIISNYIAYFKKKKHKTN